MFMNLKDKKSIRAKTLMVQGTSSHCGKTILVAALCKIFSNAGYNVAPFKSQNMSLNSFVTEKGEEIARAQALQALAAGIEPIVDMNPILLKPKGDSTSQIVVLGKPYKDMNAEDYYSKFAVDEGFRIVKRSLSKLMSNFDMIIIEGAGSPVEINIYDKDIVNMRTAELADSPVILISDIDRGGVFASIIGTLNLLKPNHQEMIKGIVINKFRGQRSVLEPGLDKLKELTGKPVLGVVPFIQDLTLPDEDSMSLEFFSKNDVSKIIIAVIRLPRISNFTDFDPLESDPFVKVRYIKSVGELNNPDAIIIPGTKNSVQDLQWLRENGLADEIVHSVKKGIPVIGICGGYQIIGKKIIDEEGIEGSVPGEFLGLDLLDIVTNFQKYEKITERVIAQVNENNPIFNSVKGKRIRGYEIRMGKTYLGKDVQPIFQIIKRGNKEINDFDGAMNKNGLVFGTYIHGVFDELPVRQSFLEYLMKKRGLNLTFKVRDFKIKWENSIIQLAEIVKSNLDMNEICKMLQIPPIES